MVVKSLTCALCFHWFGAPDIQQVNKYTMNRRHRRYSESKILIRIIKFDIWMVSCFGAGVFDAVFWYALCFQYEINKKSYLMQLDLHMSLAWCMCLCAKGNACNVQLVYKYQNAAHLSLSLYILDAFGDLLVIRYLIRKIETMLKPNS